MITVKPFSLPSWNVSLLIRTLKTGNTIDITTTGKGNGNPLQYSCLENPMDRGAWQATVHVVPRVGHYLVTKAHHQSGLSWWLRLQRLCLLMQEIQVPSLGQKDPLEKGMAFHSSILAWRIPWTEEPGRLQSMGSQRVRHDWVTNAYTTAKKNTICLYWAFHIQHFAPSAMLSTLHTLSH